MIYHYDNIPAEALTVNPPIGYDVTLKLADEYKNRIMLAAMALNVGYFLGLTEGKEEEK